MNFFNKPSHPTGPELMAGFISGCQETINDAKRSIEWWQALADKYPEVGSFKVRIQEAQERHARWVERCERDTRELREDLTKLGLLPQEGEGK